MKKKRIDDKKYYDIISNISYSKYLEHMKDVDFVVEAVSEDFGVK